jgi:hypothetical protein
MPITSPHPTSPHPPPPHRPLPQPIPSCPLPAPYTAQTDNPFPLDPAPIPISPPPTLDYSRSTTLPKCLSPHLTLLAHRPVRAEAQGSSATDQLAHPAIRHSGDVPVVLMVVVLLALAAGGRRGDALLVGCRDVAAAAALDAALALASCSLIGCSCWLLSLAALTGCSHWLLWCEAGGVRLVV